MSKLGFSELFIIYVLVSEILLNKRHITDSVWREKRLINKYVLVFLTHLGNLSYRNKSTQDVCTKDVHYIKKSPQAKKWVMCIFCTFVYSLKITRMTCLKL